MRGVSSMIVGHYYSRACVLLYSGIVVLVGECTRLVGSVIIDSHVVMILEYIGDR